MLQDINVSIKRGEVVVVIGPSGSGKSTFFRAMNRLETIDKGSIQLDGKELPAEVKELASSAPRSAWSSRASTSSPT